MTLEEALKFVEIICVRKQYGGLLAFPLEEAFMVLFGEYCDQKKELEKLKEALEVLQK